jgi:hypothetical protein
LAELYLRHAGAHARWIGEARRFMQSVALSPAQ